MTKSRSKFRVAEGFFSGAAKIVQILEAKDQALKAAELAKLLGVTRQHIYKLAAEGTIPSFQVGTRSASIPNSLQNGSAGKCRSRLWLPKGHA